VGEVRSLSRPLRSSVSLTPLLQRIGEARHVLLGEASHGTHEYYTWRAEISRRLIQEKGFRFIAVEGDWPDCYQVNRYVKGRPDSGDSAHEVLHAFERWPTWMWANEEIVEFAEWLRQHNDGRPEQQKAGFFGLDVYSLWDSLYQVLGYLGRHLPATLPAARRAFRCFEPYGEDIQEYARATRWVDASCEDEVVALLAELRRAQAASGRNGSEDRFNVEQNALVVKNAEHYYRTMVQGGPQSWNVRDRHMNETLERLMKHHGPEAKAIVWAHNTHLGDARYTDMAAEGMFNLGQLVREGHADKDVVLVGFGSHHGSVIAAVEWEAPMERMAVPIARAGCWEDILDQVGHDQLLLLDEARESDELLEERGHRAIGVVYHPEFERYGNYVPTVLPKRYDAFLFIDETHALRPLHDVKVREEGEVPETYPSGV
jgi:erythromycin esterase-like protein